MKKHIDELTKAMTVLENEDEIRRFLRDLLTPTELEEFATRFQIAKLLWTTDKSYATIASELKTSTTTVTRVARFLNKEPYAGYRMVLQRIHPKN